MDFRDHRVIDLASAVHSGRKTARELAEAALARIEAHDNRLNAFVCVDAERSLAEADEVDARLRDGHAIGPLAGIPIGVKDLEDAAGWPTRYGSLLTSDEPAEGDSVLVARLRAAGCVVIGKTATPEHGHKGKTDSLLGPGTTNPWNVDRTAGGSSGGSAAALAAGLIPLATGSDGGGSIRIPAALCGFSAIKTTAGRVPNGGPTPPGSSVLSVKGPMALRTEDTAFVLDSVVGPHPTDPFSLPRSGSPWYEALATRRLPTRVAWSPTMGFAEVDAEVNAACRKAIDALSDAGVNVVEVADIWAEDPVLPWWNLWTALRARKQGHLIGTPDWAKVDPSLQFQIEWGMKLTAVDVVDSLDQIHNYNLQLDVAFEQAPLLLTPMCAGQTPTLAGEGTINGVEHQGWVSFSYGFNLTRNPAGTVNCGQTSDGMPVGLQVVGRQLDDVSVIQAMAAFETLLDQPCRPDGW